MKKHIHRGKICWGKIHGGSPIEYHTMRKCFCGLLYCNVKAPCHKFPEYKCGDSDYCPSDAPCRKKGKK